MRYRAALVSACNLLCYQNVCFFVSCVKRLFLCILEGIALAETVAYVIEDYSDGPFYIKDLAQLYITRLKELGGIDYFSLSWLDLQMLVLQLFYKAAFPCNLL